MPHKRAKRSVRESQRKEKGANLVPSKDSLANEPIPKSLSRVLNAAKIREEYHLKKKRKLAEQDGEDKGPPGKKAKKEDKTPRILPGESMQHFNKRVETDMRASMKTAIQSSNVVTRQVMREEKKAKAERKAQSQAKQKSKQPSPSPSPPPPEDKHAHKAKEFQTVSTSAPRRLNDIAQAPPEFKKLPRGAAKASLSGSGNATKKSEGVVSMAQKAMMEQEREKAIAKYRELKAGRMKAAEENR